MGSLFYSSHSLFSGHDRILLYPTVCIVTLLFFQPDIFSHLPRIHTSAALFNRVLFSVYLLPYPSSSGEHVINSQDKILQKSKNGNSIATPGKVFNGAEVHRFKKNTSYNHL